jgi:hypothetical protein
VTFLTRGGVEESFYIDAATEEEAVALALKLSGNAREEMTGVVRATGKGAD